MHIMANHVPQQMKKHIGIKRFTGQGTRLHYNDSNNDNNNHQVLKRIMIWPESITFQAITKMLPKTYC